MIMVVMLNLIFSNNIMMNSLWFTKNYNWRSGFQPKNFCSVPFWLEMTQMRESQLWDRDWKIWFSTTRLRLKISESQKQVWAKYVDTETPSILLLISDSPFVGRGMIWSDFFLFNAVKSKHSLIYELILIGYI